MTNEISRPGSKRLRMRHAYVGFFVIAAMALGAFGTSAASAREVTAHAATTTAAKYKATKSLTYKKTGRPKLSATVSDKVSGGRKITKVVISLPKGYGWKKGKLKADLKVKNHKFTHSVSGRKLTVTPKTAVAALSVTVKRGGISETKKATSAKAGKVTLKVTEVAPIEPNALVTGLTSIETALNSGQSSVETSLNSVSSELIGQCPVVVGDLDSAVESNPQSLSVTDSLLTSYDEFLLTSLPALLSSYNSLDKVLTSLGYTSTQPLTDMEALAGIGNAGLGLEPKQLCSDVKKLVTTDSEKTLKSVESTLEKQINSYAGDVTDLSAGLTKLQTTLTNLVGSGSSLLSPSQLTTLTGLISGLQSDLSGSLGAGSSNPLSSGLSGLLSDLGLSSLLSSSSSSNPLSGLTSILSGLGLNLL